MSRTFTSTVRCYDCNGQVYDLKDHRKTCDKSRKAKSVVSSSSTQVTVTPVTAVSDNTVDFYFLLDVSSSMTGTRLTSAKQSATEIETIMADNDRMALITFDTGAYFKLKPRAVGQLRRQKELDPLLSRIFAQGATAIWDAIWLAVTQLKDKNRDTQMIVLTDGEDNSSTHTFAQVQDLIKDFPNIKLSIIHISGAPCDKYQQLCKDRGNYEVIVETEITTTIKTVFHKYYQKN